MEALLWLLCAAALQRKLFSPAYLIRTIFDVPFYQFWVQIPIKFEDYFQTESQNLQSK